MSIDAFHPKSRQKDEQIGARNEAIAVYILRAIGHAAKLTEQTEQVINGGDAVLVDVARTGSQLGSRNKAIAVHVPAQWQEGAFG